MKLQLSVKTLSFAAALAMSCPVLAQDSDEQVTDNDPNAKDVAKTPLKDLNLAKDDIPPILIEAARDPYTTSGLRRCGDIADGVRRIDAVLGRDFDVASEEEQDITAGRVGQAVVGGLIPFRGLVREVSGAAERRRAFERAILAGAVRRGFLKGLGKQRGCAPPASPTLPG